MSLRTPSQHRIDKYMNCLLYACQQREFKGSEFREAFKINHNVLTAMNELGIVHKFKPGHYRYQLMRPPTKVDVESIQKRLKAYQSVTDQPSAQLTIKPIKKVESPVPQSIIELNEKISEYPILDVAIAFLAGMVVAAFFTLIWK